MKISCVVNTNPVSLDVNPQKSLLEILREDLALIGTKEGCGKGECGACTVLMNGVRVNSCLVPAFQLQNANIVNVELDPQDFSVQVDKVLEAVSENTRVLYLCSPNNPTGSLLESGVSTGV